MDAGDWGTILAVVMVVVVFLVETAGYWGIGGWMEYRDRRSARTADDVRADIEQYGPTALGIRDELLPEEERQAVLDARRRSREKMVHH